MATVFKHSQRKALAGGTPFVGWSNYMGARDMFTVNIGDVTVQIPRDQTETLIAKLREALDNPELIARAEK